MKKILSVVAVSALVFTGCGQQQKATQTTKVDDKVAVKKNTFDKETTEYKQYVQKQIEQLLADTIVFETTLKEGKLEEAKAQYPLIRMAYERSEPIAESFSELDVKIDFRLVDFKEDFNTEEGWKGFHRIEKILWEENDTAAAYPYATELVNDIKELYAKIQTVNVTTELMIAGTIDLLNEIATQKITGEEEVFSHTDLYDFRANLEGAEKIYQIFKPEIEKNNAKLSETIQKEFNALYTLLDKYKVDDKNYKPYTDLSAADTKELSDAVNRLGEPLSQIGTIFGVK